MIAEPLVSRSEMRQVVGAVITDWAPKCVCGRTLGAFFTRPWALKCRKCGAANDSAHYRIHQHS